MSPGGPERGALAMTQTPLFPLVPEPFAPGFVYEPEWLDPAEEARLVRAIQALPLAPAEYRQFRARRRIASYGGRYDFRSRALRPSEPLPEAFHPLRRRVADWAGVPVARLTHALVTEYAPGAPLGWHRDAPDYELVVGVSLLGPGRMRVRRYPPRPREPALAIELAPRSIYRLAGEARWGWQHAISPARALRSSITFRTLRGAARGAGSRAPRA